MVGGFRVLKSRQIRLLVYTVLAALIVDTLFCESPSNRHLRIRVTKPTSIQHWKLLKSLDKCSMQR